MLFSCGVNCRIDGWIYGYCTGIVRTRLGNIGVCVCVCRCVSTAGCLSVSAHSIAGPIKLAMSEEELEERSLQRASANIRRAVLPLISS